MKHIHQKLAAPYVAKGTGGKRGLSSPFNEGISVPQAAFNKAAAKNPALNSKDRQERSEAIKKEVLKGDLAKFRRR
jgi:hypothetical protein